MSKIEYTSAIDRLGLRYFSSIELCRYYDNAVVMGIRNSYPAGNLLRNEVRKLILMDQIREALGYPIHISSLYRSPEYNAQVGGAENSRHLQGTAADLYSSDLEKLEKLIRDMRSAKAFSGGIGLYNDFIHVDFAPPGWPQTNRDWDKRT